MTEHQQEHTTTFDTTSEALPPETTQAPSFTEATIGQRAGAFLIDSLIVFAINVALSRLGYISSILGMAYMLTRDSLPFLDGQSLGKKALGIRAVTANGASLAGNWNPGLLRNVLLLVPFFPLVELIILFTKKGSPEGLVRLGDQIAKTKVVVA